VFGCGFLARPEPVYMKTAQAGKFRGQSVQGAAQLLRSEALDGGPGDPPGFRLLALPGRSSNWRRQLSPGLGWAVSSDRLGRSRPRGSAALAKRSPRRRSGRPARLPSAGAARSILELAASALARPWLGGLLGSARAIRPGRSAALAKRSPRRRSGRPARLPSAVVTRCLQRSTSRGEFKRAVDSRNLGIHGACCIPPLFPVYI
jgi:hypothetical protein